MHLQVLNKGIPSSFRMQEGLSEEEVCSRTSLCSVANPTVASRLVYTRELNVQTKTLCEKFNKKCDAFTIKHLLSYTFSETVSQMDILILVYAKVTL